MGDSNQSNAAFRFQGLQVGQVGPPVKQIVYLQRLNVVSTEKLEGLGRSGCVDRSCRLCTTLSWQTGICPCVRR